MEVIDLVSYLLGITLILGGTIISAYFLLLKNTEHKRIIVFALVVILSGCFLMLYKRITILEFLGIGEITLQAYEDAEAIRNKLNQAEAQSKAMQELVENAQDSYRKILLLTRKTLEQNIQSLTDHINDLSERIKWLQRDRSDASIEGRDTLVFGSRISELDELMYELARQRADLEKQLAELNSQFSPVETEEEK